MDVSQHLKLLAYSFITWLTFFLIGLPAYYQQWSLRAKLARSMAKAQSAGHTPQP